MGFLDREKGTVLYTWCLLSLRVEIVRQLRASLTFGWTIEWDVSCGTTPRYLGPPVGFSNFKHFEQRNAFE